MYQAPSRRTSYRQQQPQPSKSLLHRLMTRKEFLATVGVILISILVFAFYEHHRTAKSTVQKPSNTSAAAKSSDNTFNKKKYSTGDANSIWVVVNKPLPLAPLTYAPSDLVTPSIPLRVPGNESMQVRKVTASALEQLFTAAKADGLHLMLASGYRSYTYQVGLYTGYVKTQGQSSADQASARPGHSEHQTGLAADIEPDTRKCELDACFGQLSEGIWLAANAYKFGFIIRYPADKVALTGYEYEPWHVRYIGVDLATELHKTGVKTLEEFFNLKSGQKYN
ncbi:MAG TPA: M15 family metallopeptidase [Patescibacteria group bacterium]|nr:M15 family metallopeptidase [Patescibacteria group bacterium]